MYGLNQGEREGPCYAHTVPKAAHISEKYLGVYCIWEHVPWPVNFWRRFNPSPFGNFQKHLTLLPSEISEKSWEKTMIISVVFDLLTSWSEGSCLNHYTIVSPSALIAVWRYWFRLSHLSIMVIGSFASYTKTKSVESAVWCLLTLDDDGVEQAVANRYWCVSVMQDRDTWTGSGSELLFFLSNNNQNKNQMKMKQIIEQRTITDQ